MSLKEKMTALADAVRKKAELTDTLTIDEMTAAITNLTVGGGTDTSDATATANDIVNGKFAYGKDGKIWGNLTETTIHSVANEVTVYAGYVKTTQKITVGTIFSESIIYPGTEDFEIPAKSYVIAGCTIKGDANLLPENIVANEQIFNVRGTFSADATAWGEDILEGKTAYNSGQKVTGSIKTVEPEFFYQGKRVRIPKGFINDDVVIDLTTLSEDATATVWDILEGQTAYVKGDLITGTISVDPEIHVSGNHISIPAGCQSSERNYDIGNIYAVGSITPSTDDQIIPADSYIASDVTIKGDSALISDNIKAGVSIFGVAGNYTGGGGAVPPIWHNPQDWGDRLLAMLPPCLAVQTPPRQGWDFLAYNGTLYRRTSWFSYTGTGRSWTYVSSFNADRCLGIGGGKLYDIYNQSGDTFTSRPIADSVTGVTQVLVLDDGRSIFNSADKTLHYAAHETYKGKVEYTREKDSDPVQYVTVNKILNCSQSKYNACVITADGSIAHIWEDDNNERMYAEIDASDNAGGNAFVNYFPQQSDGYGDSYSATYELAFRTDGLWYRKTGGYWDGSKTRYYEWRKANDPGLRKTDWLGYCSTSASENWGWNEETGEEYVEWSISESQVALHIDTKGRLWKLSLSGSIVDNSFTPSGLNITQIGTDTDWQCVPASVGRNQRDLYAQKGGKLLKLSTTDTDSIALTWEEHRIQPTGRMLCSYGRDIWFAPEDETVDLAKAGGTY
jgi:hypothetical protein